MIIIHGPDQVSALEKLDQLLDTAKEKNQEIEKVECKTLSPAKLSQALTSSSLFSDHRLIIINDLLSLPQSNSKKNLLDILKKTNIKNLILFETKNIHPATVKSLSASKVDHFKQSPLVFKLLDNLQPGNPKPALDVLNDIVKSRQPLDMLFFMIIRHIRQLIQVKTPGALKLAPWQLSKLSRQSSLFTTDQLINLHQQLYKIDRRQKLSQVKGLETELKHLILDL